MILAENIFSDKVLFVMRNMTRIVQPALIILVMGVITGKDRVNSGIHNFIAHDYNFSLLKNSNDIFVILILKTTSKLDSITRFSILVTRFSIFNSVVLKTRFS